MIPSFVHVFSSLIYASLVYGTQTRTYQLELTNKYISPDGYNKSSTLANGQFEGPLLIANKGDQLQVNVINRLTDSSMAQGTSIHWHGLYQQKTAAQDGATWVSQCPIAPGDSFLYKFSAGDQTGTYWYHSHITTQYCDGLRGPLVIYDPKDPLRSLYDIDDKNTVITIGDWYRLPSPAAFQTFELPQSTVINGLGRYAAGPKSPLAVISVKSGTRYRFRIINTACASSFDFSIDNHRLTVIEADGAETKPLTVDSLSIFAGQRYSVIVEASQPVNNYWIRATAIYDGGTPNTVTGVDAAILRYNGAENIEPQTTQTGTLKLREQNLVSLNYENLAEKIPDESMNLEIGVDSTELSAKTNFTVNGNVYQPPSVPILLQILNGSTNPHSYMPNGSVITLPRNKLVQITIPGGSVLSPHPFHLHGHKFQVAVSTGSTERVNGPFRDVVNTGLSGDNVTFLFRTDNPGPWILHCHIEWHLEAKLAIVFAEAPDDQISGPYSEETPTNWKALCPRWNALKSGKQYSVSDLE